MTNADTFKRTLLQIEATRNPLPLVELFSDSATIDTPAHEQKLSGRADVETFWQGYLDAFADVQSTFTVDHTIGDTSILEWVSEGHLPTGRPIRYRGVSIVTFRGYKVASFTAYYDSAAFLAPASEAQELTVAVGANNDEGGD